MPSLRADYRSTTDLVEGFHLCHAATALRDLGVLDALRAPMTVEELARKCRLDAAMLRGVLEFLAVRTDLVQKRGKRFLSTRNYNSASRFLLDLYAGAYRGNAVQLKDLLRDPSQASAKVDRGKHSLAFSEVTGSSFEWLAQIINQLELKHVLDIGCGPAALLLQLAEADCEFSGWGLEGNSAMCKLAKSRIREAGVAKRIKLIQGDATRISDVLSSRVRSKVQTVTACQLVNEWFAGGQTRVVQWLNDLRQALPGRILLLADYYGRLGNSGDRQNRETLLHDYSQTISGQGVPPSSVRQWKKIHKTAGCRLVHVVEDRNTTRFLHIIQL